MSLVKDIMTKLLSSKKFIFITVTLILLITYLIVARTSNNVNESIKLTNINSYEECVNLPNETIKNKSYGECELPDGRIFKQQIQGKILIGLLRDSGLYPDEKSKIGLNQSDYQITDLYIDAELKGEILNTGEPNPHLLSENGKNYEGAFIEKFPVNVELASYLGKCVKASYSSLLDTEISQNNEETYFYDRIPVEIFGIEQIEYNECNPYQKVVTDVYNEDQSNYLVERGVLNRISRLAPDINYDYELILDTPCIGCYPSARGDGEEIKSITILPSSNDHWEFIEKYFTSGGNKSVSLSGLGRWGYAETWYFLVENISE